MVFAPRTPLGAPYHICWAGKYWGRNLHVTSLCWQNKTLLGKPNQTKTFKTRGPFIESPETFRTHFRLNYLCIFRREASQGRKLCRYFKLYSNIRKKKTALQTRRVGVLRTALRPLRDFRKTGPRHRFIIFSHQRSTGLLTKTFFFSISQHHFIN